MPYTYSIIIPHKNIPTILKRCLSTIPEDNDFQIIVVDDNSDPEVVDFNNFPGSERSDVKIVFCKDGKGAGFARNIGLKYATGKWLIFADSDDFFNPCFADSIRAYRDSSAEIVYFSASSLDNYSLKPSIRHINLEKAINNYSSRNKRSVDDIKYSNWEPWSKMFRRSFTERLNLKFDEIMVGNDMGFVLKAGHNAKSIEVDRNAIYCVTFRKDSLTYFESESSFDNRFEAVLLSNRYLADFNKKYVRSIIPDIYQGRKYGWFKVVKMCVHAIRRKNNIFRGSGRYINRLFSREFLFYTRDR